MSREYFDTLVKSDKQFAFYVPYILENPVTARLCQKWPDWPWECALMYLTIQWSQQMGRLEASVTNRKHHPTFLGQ